MDRIKKLLFYFIVFSFVGFIWEVIVDLVYLEGLNNPGTMMGPYVPIYGVGGLLIYFLSIKLKDKPLVLFIVSFLLSGILEYSTALFLENIYNMKWWDYSDMPLNFHGRIFFLGLVGFSLAGMFAVYVVVPYMDKLINKFNKKAFNVFLIVFVVFFIIDFMFSIVKPNTLDAKKLYNERNKIWVIE